MKYYNSEVKANATHQIKKSKDGAKTSGQISDDSKCLVHHNANHTWGECYSNSTRNPQGQEKSQQASQK
jgi:hypothetical protein